MGSFTAAAVRDELAGLEAVRMHDWKSRGEQGWILELWNWWGGGEALKRPLSPVVPPALPRAPLTHVPKCYIHTAFKSLQGRQCHPCPEPGLNSPFHGEIFPNIQSKCPLAQMEAVSSCPLTCHLGGKTNPPPGSTLLSALRKGTRIPITGKTHSRQSGTSTPQADGKSECCEIQLIWYFCESGFFSPNTLNCGFSHCISRLAAKN